jgi:spore maturation protein B
MTAYIIPAIFLSVLLLSLILKKDAYSAFIGGAKDALSLVANVFPYLLAIMAAVEVFRASGVSSAVSNFLSPFVGFFGIPKEVTELILIRPLSGAGALGVLENVFKTYGADTYIGKCASVIYGSSETIFYISAIYFSQSNVKKLRFAIPVALIAAFAGSIIGCYICKFI